MLIKNSEFHGSYAEIHPDLWDNRQILGGMIDILLKCTGYFVLAVVPT